MKPTELEEEYHSTYDSVTYDPVKLDCWSWKQKRKNKPITVADSGPYDWLVLPFLPLTPTI